MPFKNPLKKKSDNKIPVNKMPVYRLFNNIEPTQKKKESPGKEDTSCVIEMTPRGSTASLALLAQEQLVCMETGTSGQKRDRFAPDEQADEDPQPRRVNYKWYRKYRYMIFHVIVTTISTLLLMLFIATLFAQLSNKNISTEITGEYTTMTTLPTTASTSTEEASSSPKIYEPDQVTWNEIQPLEI